MQGRWISSSDFYANLLALLKDSVANIACLPLLNWCLKRIMDTGSAHKYSLTLSDSLAKNIAPLPTPNVPFFFFPFLPISVTDHVVIGSALDCDALEEATLSAGST
jgi:hypothetical protein